MTDLRWGSRSSMTSPPAMIVQVCSGSNDSGPAASSGHVPSWRTRSLPNKPTPSTAKARTSGLTWPAGSKPSVPCDASTAALTSSTEADRTDPAGVTPSASQRAAGSSAPMTTLLYRSLRPSMAERTSSRAMSRSGDQKRSTGTNATPCASGTGDSWAEAGPEATSRVRTSSAAAKARGGMSP